MEVVGEINEIPKEFAIEWKIREFSSLSPKVDEFYVSPIFHFADASWLLQIYLNGQRKGPLKSGGLINSEGYIDLFLCRICSGNPITLDFDLGFKSLDGKSSTVRHFTRTFTRVEFFGGYKFISRSSLLKMKPELTAVCRIKHCASAEISSKSFDRIS